MASCMKSHKPLTNRKGRPKQGYFTNVTKYVGESAPIYRSSYEFRAFLKCENTPAIVKWSSEPMDIPYIDAYGKYHTYTIDLVTICIDGVRYLIEVKPAYQCKAGSYDYDKNSRKWAAAIDFCKKESDAGRPTKFKIWTEAQLM